MINKSHIIFYVDDQQKSTEFYTTLLNHTPELNVPGMTEFHLSSTTVFGLMPASGIKKLLGDKIEKPERENSQPRAELYLLVDNIENYINRAVKLGAKKLDDLKERDWGHRVIYFEDLDGYIVAFAEEIKKSRFPKFMNKAKRKDHEPPPVTKKGMRFHHIGIPTKEKKPNEKYIEHLKFYVSGFETSEFGIEWMRFEDDSPVANIIKQVPHIAFEVDNLEEAIKDKEPIDDITSPSKGVRVAMIIENGAPVELIEFSEKD